MTTTGFQCGFFYGDNVKPDLRGDVYETLAECKDKAVELAEIDRTGLEKPALAIGVFELSNEGGQDYILERAMVGTKRTVEQIQDIMYNLSAVNIEGEYYQVLGVYGENEYDEDTPAQIIIQEPSIDCLNESEEVPISELANRTDVLFFKSVIC